MSCKNINIIIFKRTRFGYIDSFCDCEWLSMLGEIFDDGKSNNNWIIRELLNPSSKGITGNKIDLTFKGDKVFIEPLYTEDPSEFRIEIDRNQLLQVINDWDEVIKQRPDEIVITKHEDNTITVMGKFNENLS